MIRLLPLLLLVALIAFTIRVGEVVTGFRDLSGAAVAADAPKEKEADKPAEKSKTDKAGDKDAKDTKEDPSAKDTKGDTKDKPKDAKAWPDAVDMDPELAEVRAGLVKDLADRRKKIEQRERDLATREAVLKAAEDEIDQKFRELTELRKQLQNLLGQQSELEEARLKSLVRIYEGMKPAEAARIFNTLETTILLDVMTRMSERKSSPVLAAMDPDRARTITLLMAQQRSLPEIPDLDGGAPPAENKNEPL